MMMKTLKHWKKRHALLLAGSCALLGLLPVGALAGDDDDSSDDRYEHGANICGKTTSQLLKACRFEARDDATVESAVCLNVRDRFASETCLQAARTARTEALARCVEIKQARNDVCAKLGTGPYDPVIDPANFVAGINNRYTPFPPGAFRVYEKKTAAGLERIRVEVLPETRVIQGVTVTTLRDTVFRNGVLIEDTKDWLAQDRQGNVWYMGEIVQNFEEGLLANLNGSFEAGKNSAKAGYWSTAFPQVGDFYRQEWSLNNAEDVVEVVSLDARDTTVPFSQYATGPILKVRATTPLSPSEVEFKYYVPGVGFALEVKPATGERLELVDFGPR